VIPDFFTPYRYKRPRPKRPDAPSFPNLKEDEGLTGMVMGKDASDLEERFARALNTYSLDFAFQFFVETAHSLPYQEKQVDFVVYSGQPEPWEVDGEFTHKSAEQREYDRARDALVDESLKDRGFAPVQRITEEYLVNQEAANLFVAEHIA
jgi:hypothetical protein